MKQLLFERVGVWVVAMGWLLSGTGAVTADSITVGESSYVDVLVMDSSSAYYILLPDEGKSIRVPRAKVKESEVIISEDQDLRYQLRQRYDAAAEAVAAVKGHKLDERASAIFKLEKDLAVGAKGPKAPELKLAMTLKKGPIAPADATLQVIEFWATWCGPCRSSIPHLTKLQAKYAPKGVAFVGVTTESFDVALPYVMEMGDRMNYTVVSDHRSQTSRAYRSLFGVRTIPHAYIVDGDGRVAWHGHPMEPQFESMLSLLTQ